MSLKDFIAVAEAIRFDMLHRKKSQARNAQIHALRHIYHPVDFEGRLVMTSSVETGSLFRSSNRTSYNSFSIHFLGPVPGDIL